MKKQGVWKTPDIKQYGNKFVEECGYFFTAPEASPVAYDDAENEEEDTRSPDEKLLGARDSLLGNQISIHISGRLSSNHAS